MSQPTPPSDYYLETVTIVLDRLTLLTVIMACFLALKHPTIPDTVTVILKDTLKQLLPLVNDYAPNKVLQDWQTILETP